MLDDIKFFKEIKSYGFDLNEYALVHSAWLPLLKIRKNGDLDIIISKKLRKEIFSKEFDLNATGLPGPLEKRLRVQPSINFYTKYFNLNCNEIINHHSLIIDGVRFVYLSAYLEMKIDRLSKNLKKKYLLFSIRKKLNLLLRSEVKILKKIEKDRVDLKNIYYFLNSENLNHEIMKFLVRDHKLMNKEFQKKISCLI